MSGRVEEVLEGLRSINPDRLVDSDHEAVTAAIAYLEGLPTPDRIFKELSNLGFFDAEDLWGTDELSEIFEGDRKNFLAVVGGL